MELIDYRKKLTVQLPLRRSLRKLAALPAVAALGIAGLLSGATAAEATPAGGYVSFGDSFPANPSLIGGATQGGAGGCLQDANNIGRQVAGQLNLELHDYSCNGSVVYVPTQPPQKHLAAQVDAAQARGDLNPGTKLVTFFIGANDTMQGALIPAPIQDGEYIRNQVDALNRVHALAPNARVMVVGYPGFSSSDPGHYVCPVNVAGFAPQIPGLPVNLAETGLQNRQIESARQGNAQFVDLKQISGVNVGMCGRDGERQVSAVLDGNLGSYNMPAHPTYVGQTVIANTIAGAYRG